jgi:transposase-like protein
VSYLEVAMPKRYAREFRRAVCERLVARERISKVSNETGVSLATLHRWRVRPSSMPASCRGTKS